MKCRIVFGALFLGALSVVPVFAQTEQEKARIDYEAAKIALQQDKPEIALAKFEAVMAVLGEQPELLCLAAQAALEAGDYDKANDYKQRAFAKADDKFKKSPGYQKFIELSARLELLADPAARQRDQEDRARRELLTRGVAPSEDALHAAVQRGDLETVRLICKAGIKAQLFQDLIIKMDDSMVLELFHLGAGAVADALCGYVMVPDSGSPPRHLSTFKELLDALPNSNFSCDAGTDSHTPFLAMLTKFREWPAAVTLTVQRGAAVNAQDSLGATALWSAAEACHNADVVALLAAGADPKIKDTNVKCTPLKAIGYFYPASRKTPECKATRATLEKAN